MFVRGGLVVHDETKKAAKRVNMNNESKLQETGETKAREGAVRGSGANERRVASVYRYRNIHVPNWTGREGRGPARAVVVQIIYTSTYLAFLCRPGCARVHSIDWAAITVG